MHKGLTVRRLDGSRLRRFHPSVEPRSQITCEPPNTDVSRPQGRYQDHRRGCSQGEAVYEPAESIESSRSVGVVSDQVDRAESGDAACTTPQKARVETQDTHLSPVGGYACGLALKESATNQYGSTKVHVIRKFVSHSPRDQSTRQWDTPTDLESPPRSQQALPLR